MPDDRIEEIRKFTERDFQGLGVNTSKRLLGTAVSNCIAVLAAYDEAKEWETELENRIDDYHTKIESLIIQGTEIKKRNDELEGLFDRQINRYGIADKYWREHHKGSEHVSPDLGDLLDFLMEMITLYEVTETGHLADIDKLRDDNAKLREALEKIRFKIGLDGIKAVKR